MRAPAVRGIDPAGAEWQPDPAMPLRTRRRDHGEVIMATKTVVCPDCGSQAAPGRYACGECGALLDGVAVRPRSGEVAPTVPAAPVAADAQVHPDLEPEPETSMFADDDVADDVADPSERWQPHDEFVPVDPTVPPPADQTREVQWPPPGDRGPLPAREPRIPAGTYLPPSALLTGLDAPAATASVALASAATGDRIADAAPRDWLAGLGSPERRWESARRTIAIGAAVAVLGFLLPWANGSASTILNVWLNVWGLAYAGHWLIVVGLATVGAAAALAGRTESWPLGVPAVALASLLLGLVWPLVFGAAGRPFGVLVVLVGAIVLGVGGVLQLGARHEAATPSV